MSSRRGRLLDRERDRRVGEDVTLIENVSAVPALLFLSASVTVTFVVAEIPNSPADAGVTTPLRHRESPAPRPRSGAVT